MPRSPDGGAQNCLDQMLTRKELYATIDYAAFEALDATIVKTVVPEAMPQESELKESGRFLKKAAQKLFFMLGPMAVPPARPKLIKFFCFFLFTKRSPLLASLSQVHRIHSPGYLD